MALTPAQMFSDRSGAAVIDRFEEYKDLLKGSIDRSDEGRDFFMAKSAGGTGQIARNVRPPKDFAQRRDAELGLLDTLAKSVSGDALAQMEGQLTEMRERLSKDWDSNFPESGNITIPNQLAPIDLEGPAKMLVPRTTPILNEMPRVNDGIGSAVNYKRILGWSNSGTGGMPDLMPFMASEFPAAQSTSSLPVFGGYANTSGGVSSGGLGLRRGQKITYVADKGQVTYVELSLSDVVSSKAAYISQGYQDVRQLSATALLWAHKQGEERAMLYGRGVTSLGYTGPVAAPSPPSAVTAANTGGSIPNGTYSVVITAIAGGGESAPSTVVTASAITGSNVGTLNVVFPVIPAGGLGWNIWALNAATGNFFFQASVANGNASFLLTSYNATGPTLAYNSTTDTTANPNGYDGLLTVLLNPAVSGYVGTYATAGTLANSVNSVGGGVAGTVACGDTPWQNAFQALYGATTNPGNYGMTSPGSAPPSWPWNQGTAYGQKLLASPKKVFVDGAIRAAMGQFVRKAAGGSTAYRIMLQPADSTGGHQVGDIVSGIVNQVTGDMCDFEPHPYMNPGNSVLWTQQLPIPDSEVTNTIEAKNVQDYLYQMWPQIQFTWDASTYQLGSLVFYAPAWSGAITGLLP